MIEVDVLMNHRLRVQESQRMAEQNRLARLARQARRPHPRPVRRRVGQLLIAAGQLLAGQPSYNAYEEALAVADRSWS